MNVFFFFVSCLLMTCLVVSDAFSTANDFPESFLGGPRRYRRCNDVSDCGGNPRAWFCTAGKCIARRPSRSFKPPKKACSTGADCDDASTCVDGKCRVNNGSGGACSADAFCPDNYQCVDSECEPIRKMFVDDSRVGTNEATLPVWCKPPSCVQ